MTKDPRRDLRSYRNKVTRERKKAERNGATCHLCLQAIDMTLPYLDKWAWTLDHLDSLASGGHINGTTLPAHRRCNSAKGDGKKVNPLAGMDKAW